MCKNLGGGRGVKVFLGKHKVDFTLVVSWVQSFLQEIRLHRGPDFRAEKKTQNLGDRYDWTTISIVRWNLRPVIFGVENRVLSHLGRTPKGAYSPRGRSRHLLETPFSEPLLRTLLRIFFLL